MKVTDYIIDFFVSKGVTDIFGYPGGCINHLMDSARKNEMIRAHVNYNEQGAAFAACGYAQASGKLGVAFATSGPGATNLVTGIAGAFFDSVPSVFITGQVDSNTEKGTMKLRQKGFQETDMVAVTSSIAKWAYHVKNAQEIKYCLEKAYYLAFSDCPGPVVLDIPNDIQRMDVDVESLEGYCEFNQNREAESSEVDNIIKLLQEARRPVILAGYGVKTSQMKEQFVELIDKIKVPVVSSMPAVDLLPFAHDMNFGYIGTNGHRYGNLITNKCDVMFVLGSRMDIRQIGLTRSEFAPCAKIIRVDIDPEQLNYKVKNDEIAICSDLRAIIPSLLQKVQNANIPEYDEWLEICREIKGKTLGYDDEAINRMVVEISNIIEPNRAILADVGQNLLWISNSYHFKEGQKFCASTGNAAMGYSLPAAIGAYYATRMPVVSFCGDGGLMMNVQELLFLKRENLPIKVVCINNLSLGMIRAWQERYLGEYSLTTEKSGYLAPNCEKLAYAFEIPYYRIENEEDISKIAWNDECPALIEIVLDYETETKPLNKLQDQSPLLERVLYDEIMKL